MTIAKQKTHRIITNILKTQHLYSGKLSARISAVNAAKISGSPRFSALGEAARSTSIGK